MTDTKYLVIGKDERVSIVNTDEGARIMAEDPKNLVVFPYVKDELPSIFCLKIPNALYNQGKFTNPDRSLYQPGDIIVLREWCIPEQIYSGCYKLMMINQNGELVHYDPNS